MLAITRKINQKVQIGDGITVHVDNIQKGDIFLSITLPSGEVKYEAINEDEKIQITDDVVIRAALIKGKGQARIAITAPKSMVIKRL